MKIIKPDDMAIVHRALRLQGQDRLCVGLVALFPLLPSGSPAPAALLPETELWQRLPQAPGAPTVLDEGYPKPQAEFLLYGEACAPGGTAVTELAVRARVGTLDKALIVRGDRRWGALGTASSAVPFTRMPIVPATAFGGPGDPANLLGKSAPALPNVEDPRHPIAFEDDRSVAAGFWGVDSSAPQRQRHLGAVGTPWLQKTWPHLPEDTADAFFQSAPADQRMAGGAGGSGAGGGGFRGDETIALTHLHPVQARIESALPALRARCFAQRGQGADGAPGVFEEIRTHAETVWLMPSLGLGAVLYRGTLAVSDEEARDVACIVTGWEPMGDTPWPEAHYREQMQPVSAGEKAAQATQPAANVAATLATAATAATAASAPPALGVVAGAAAAAGAAFVAGSAVKAAVTAAEDLPVNAATDPLPGVNPTSAERVAPAAEQAVANIPATDPELAQIERMTADMEAQTQRLLAAHGIPRSQIDAMMQPPPQPEVSLAEIEGFTHKLQAEHAALLADNGLTQADVDAFIQSRQVELPGEVSLADIETHTQAMREQTQQLMRDNGIDHDDVADFLASRGASKEAVSLMRQFPSLVALSAGAVAAPLHAALPAPAPAPAAGEAGAEKTADPAAAASAPAAPPVDVAAAAAAAPPPPAPHSPTTREEVIAWHAEARSFAGLALVGLDLSDLDLSGADFSGATLEHTRFDRSRLAGTRFDRAILQGASLEAIDGTQASFEAARAAGSRFANATLTGATLNAADFSTGDFTGANLQGAHCARTDFSDACMAGLRGAKLQAVQADFSRCNLQAASLQGATLTAARFDQASIEGASLATAQAERSEWYEAQARQADFAGADLRGARAGAGTVFAGANLRGANMEGAAWADGVDLQGAALQGACIERADFSGAQAAHLVMSGASARGANFSRAALQGADATGADLMGASLRHAQLAGTRFAGANLHGSDCYGSTIAQAHVAGALTTATLMQIAGRPEAVKA